MQVTSIFSSSLTSRGTTTCKNCGRMISASATNDFGFGLIVPSKKLQGEATYREASVRIILGQYNRQTLLGFIGYLKGKYGVRWKIVAASFLHGDGAPKNMHSTFTALSLVACSSFSMTISTESSMASFWTLGNKVRMKQLVHFY